jgi:hypothetical protein
LTAGPGRPADPIHALAMMPAERKEDIMSTTTTNKPVEKIRVGSVQVSIWRNEGQEGPFFTASVELSYKDGDQWRTSTSYGLRDLINLAKAALLAHSAIGKLKGSQVTPDESEGD